MACEEVILSEEYADFIFQNSISETIPFFQEVACIQNLDEVYRTEYVPLKALSGGRGSQPDNGFYLLAGLPLLQVPYYSVPKLYGLMDRSSMEASRITDVQNQPALSLTGGGVLVGVIDTGIDWSLSIFQKPSGKTRIVALWDQAGTEGPHPANFSYGREYTQGDINLALTGQGEIPKDPLGHGTFLAGIMAGSEDIEQDFIGAAPNADIAVVKLKEAKRYLREYFQVPLDVPAFQENDVMAGAVYLHQLATARRQPLVICIGIGSNQGSHSGVGPLQEVLSRIAKLPQHVVCVAGGNESGRSSHYFGRMEGQMTEQTVELRVDARDKGFTMEFWARSPELYTISLQSPTGETISNIPGRVSQSQLYGFVFEETKVIVDYALAEPLSGNFMIQLRFQNPTPGIWKIRASNSLFVYGGFHIWLPIYAFMSGETIFLRPNPDTTLSEPGNAAWVMTVAGYQHRDGSLYLHSGRGYTSTEIVKPYITAPAVEVYGPEGSGAYGYRTGTSIAAAHAAGASALLLEWAVIRRNSVNMNTGEAATYLIRGAKRVPGREYPNREWGFGILDLYSTFEVLATI